MAEKVRLPAVAGTFYPGENAELSRTLKHCFTHELGPGKLPPSTNFPAPIALISPHAGYAYSGPVAAHGFYSVSSLTHIDLAIILGPNHWGLGSGVASVDSGSWRTSLGDVAIDSESVRELVGSTNLVHVDDRAHSREHSIEVQIPFLQHIFSNHFKILPISMYLQDKKTAEELASGLLPILMSKKAILIASSDLTHYETHDDATRKDQKLIGTIEALDLDKFYDTLESDNVTACGYGPIGVAISVLNQIGVVKGRLLKYATSGDTTKDFSSVVGYASIVFEK
ncbi:MAG: AmmeMemoRadiSam system protein B [Nitrososphaerales archaeon]